MSGPGKLSRAQRFVLWLMPGRAEAIERETREWRVTCPNCGHERSLWDLGGVKYKAKSKGERLRRQCENCGQSGWHPVRRNTD